MSGRTQAGKEPQETMAEGATRPPKAPQKKAPPKARGSQKARRNAARLAAVQILYQVDITGIGADRGLAEFIEHRIGQELDGDLYVPADPQLLTKIVRGSAVRQAEVDAILTEALDPRAPLERMELLLKATLRAGAYELLAHLDIPPGIIICGYVDVAHAFFGGREPALVNGVLDRLGRTLRQDAAGPSCTPEASGTDEDDPDEDREP